MAKSLKSRINKTLHSQRVDSLFSFFNDLTEYLLIEPGIQTVRFIQAGGPYGPSVDYYDLDYSVANSVSFKTIISFENTLYVNEKLEDEEDRNDDDQYNNYYAEDHSPSDLNLKSFIKEVPRENKR